jgi:hypothetical protein
MIKFTPEQASDAYDILVKHAGAREDERHYFVRTLLENDVSLLEFRFRGHLGTGGKFKHNGGNPVPYVDCYHEEMTAEKRAIIETTNAALAEYFTPTPAFSAGS